MANLKGVLSGTCEHLESSRSHTSRNGICWVQLGTTLGKIRVPFLHRMHKSDTLVPDGYAWTGHCVTRFPTSEYRSSILVQHPPRINRGVERKQDRKAHAFAEWHEPSALWYHREELTITILFRGILWYSGVHA
jgi:hypothetical protein